MALTLIYWPSLPGRGEFIRLLLEGLELDYSDVARSDGAAVVAKQRGDASPGPPAFAPPMLIDDAADPPRRVAQTAAILLYVDDVYGPYGDPAIDRYAKVQAMLTVMDVVAEAHDTHHPLDVTEPYEAQRDAAVARARVFREARIPKFLDLFEAMAASAAGNTDGDGLLGGSSYVDLALAHLVGGLRYAFPTATARALEQTPRVAAIATDAFAVPAVAAYRRSDRCLPFGETGIFRSYPELQEPS